MSVRVMSMVWDSTAFSGNTKLIMLCLADYANDEGWCWPSYDAIARKCCISRSTVKAQIKRLIEQHVLNKTTRKKTTEDGYITNDSNIYQIDVSHLKALLREQENTAKSGGEKCPRSEIDLGQNSQGGGSKSDPKPSLDPSKEILPPKVPQADKPNERNTANGDNPAPEKTTHAKTPRATKTSRSAETKGAGTQPASGKRKTALPEHFTVTDEMREWYQAQRQNGQPYAVNIDDATAQWCDAMIARGNTYTNWHAAWRNGMRNANKWAQQRGPQHATNINQIGARDDEYGPPEEWQ